MISSRVVATSVKPAAVRSSRDRWRAALRGLGLSDQLTPKQIRQLCDRSGKLVQFRTRLDELQRQLEFRSRELVSIQSQVAKLASVSQTAIHKLLTGKSESTKKLPQLARALYRSVEVGKPIPETLFVAVAEVLAMIYRTRQKRLSQTQG